MGTTGCQPAAGLKALGSQDVRRIGRRRAAGGDNHRHERAAEKYRRGKNNRHWIAGTNASQQTDDQPAGQQRAGESDCETNRNRTQAPANDQPQDVGV